MPVQPIDKLSSSSVLTSDVLGESGDSVDVWSRRRKDLAEGF